MDSIRSFLIPIKLEKHGSRTCGSAQMMTSGATTLTYLMTLLYVLNTGWFSVKLHTEFITLITDCLKYTPMLVMHMFRIMTKVNNALGWITPWHGLQHPASQAFNSLYWSMLCPISLSITLKGFFKKTVMPIWILLWILCLGWFSSYYCIFL